MSAPPSPAAAAAAAKSAHEFLVEEFTLLSIGALFVVLRTISRLLSVGIKKFQLDDYLMLFALILYGLESGAAYMVGFWFHGLANNSMTTAHRMALTPDNPEYGLRVGGSKVQLVGWNLYTLLLWTLKMCMCVFYERLTSGLGDAMKLRIRIGYVAIVVTYIVTMLSILLPCMPFHKNWQIYPDPGNICQPAISKINCLVTVVLNVITDLYLMSIPLPLMWRAQLPIMRKLLLMGMFSGGFFVIAAGILRATLILIDPVGGAQAAGSWAVRETFVSVIIGNLPMVYKLFRLLAKNGSEAIKERTDRSRTGRIELSGDDDTSASKSAAKYGPGSAHVSRTSNKRNRFLHPLSMRADTTTSESQEELHMDTIKEHGVVVTTELSLEEKEQRATSAAGKDAYSAYASPRDQNYIYAGPEEKRQKFTTSTVQEDQASSSSSSDYRSHR